MAGASGAAAADAQHEFLPPAAQCGRVFRPAHAGDVGSNLEAWRCGGAFPSRAVSKDLLITANLVRESGANLITLCPSQTPLAELSTVNLAIDVREDTGNLHPADLAYRLTWW